MNMHGENMKRTKRGNYEIEDESDFELTPEQAADFERRIEEADKELDECRVNFRWQKDCLELVKQAAAMIGVPYQTYIKQVLYKQAHEDCKNYARKQDRPISYPDLTKADVPQVREAQVEHAFALNQLGRIAMERGDYEAAAKYFEQVIGAPSTPGPATASSSAAVKTLKEKRRKR